MPSSFAAQTVDALFANGVNTLTELALTTALVTDPEGVITSIRSRILEESLSGTIPPTTTSSMLELVDIAAEVVSGCNDGG